MKRIFISFLAVLGLALSVQAQNLDGRIDAALMQMPAQTAEQFNSVMESFTGEITDFVELLSSRLVPASEGENARIEYLMNGFVAYLSAPQNNMYRAETAKALEKAVAGCKDPQNKVFLQDCLYLLSQYSQPEAYRGLTLSQAKSQLKKKDAHLKSEAVAALFDIQGEAALPYALKAMKDRNREYRMAVLHLAGPYADEEFYASLAGLLDSASPSVKLDIIRWFGYQKPESQVGTLSALVGAEDAELAQATIASLGKIGGEQALNVLVSCLGGAYDACASSTLLRFNGDIGPAVLEALNRKPAESLLKLAGQRRLYAACEKVLSLLSSDDKTVSDAAYDALAGVVTAADFHVLCDLLETVSEDNVPKVQRALTGVVPVLPSDVCLMRMAKSQKKSLYYPALAEIGDTKSIEQLMKEFETENRQLAMASLLKVDNAGMADVLYRIALADRENADQALDRYVFIIRKYLSDPIARYEACSKALQLNPSDAVVSSLLKTLSGTQVKDAIFVAAPYLENENTAHTAAETIKHVAAKNIDVLKGEQAVKALEAAREQFRKGGSADDGYAVDEIDSLLEKM